MLDEGNPGPSQIVFQDKKGEDQGLPTPETSIPGVVDGTEHSNNRTSDATDPCHRGQSSCEYPSFSPPEEDTGNTRYGEGEPAEASGGMCQYHRVIRPADTHD